MYCEGSILSSCSGWILFPLKSQACETASGRHTLLSASSEMTRDPEAMPRSGSQPFFSLIAQGRKWSIHSLWLNKTVSVTQKRPHKGFIESRGLEEVDRTRLDRKPKMNDFPRICFEWERFCAFSRQANACFLLLELKSQQSQASKPKQTTINTN